MSRPAHIAALDKALKEQLHRLNRAEEVVQDRTRLHIRALDEMSSVRQERASAFSAVRDIEDAIRTLGYVVCHPSGGTVPRNESVLGERTYSTQKDEEEARKAL